MTPWSNDKPWYWEYLQSFSTGSYLIWGVSISWDLAVYVDVILASRAFEIILSGPFHEHAAWNAIHSCKVRWIHIDMIHLSILRPYISRWLVNHLWPADFHWSFQCPWWIPHHLASGGRCVNQAALNYQCLAYCSVVGRAERLPLLLKGLDFFWCRTVTCWRV